MDGIGLRTSIYCAGCLNRCEGCHNPQSWDLNGGYEMTVDRIFERVAAADMNVTFTGGDPMLQAEGFALLAERIKRETDKTIWCYTGYLFEDCAAVPQRRRLLESVDVLVDGPFLAAERDLSLRFRGSRNQRIIDVRRTMNNGLRIVPFAVEELPAEGCR